MTVLPRPTRARPAVARVLAVLAALACAVLFMGVVDLLVPLLRTPGFYDAYLLETGYGVLAVGLLTLPLLASAGRPGSPGPAAEVGVVAVALGLAGAVTPAPPLLVVAVVLLAIAGALRRLGGAARASGRRAPSRAGWALALVGALGALPYAADMVAAGREGRPPVDVTNGLDHWPVQAALALALPAVAALAAARRPGWAVPACTAALSAGWFGALSVAFPDHPASLGAAGGGAAVAWGALLALDALRTAVRTEDGPGDGAVHPGDRLARSVVDWLR
jgi:hypothetical protein